MSECPRCGRKYKDMRGLSAHLRAAHPKLRRKPPEKPAPKATKEVGEAVKGLREFKKEVDASIRSIFDIFKERPPGEP